MEVREMDLTSLKDEDRESVHSRRPRELTCESSGDDINYRLKYKQSFIFLKRGTGESSPALVPL